jgi:hypothetical protein
MYCLFVLSSVFVFNSFNSTKNKRPPKYYRSGKFEIKAADNLIDQPSNFNLSCFFFFLDLFHRVVYFHPVFMSCLWQAKIQIFHNQPASLTYLTQRTASLYFWSFVFVKELTYFLYRFVIVFH